MKFTTVTWYSQLTAIVLAVAIFLLGMYVGRQSVILKTNTNIPVAPSTPIAVEAPVSPFVQAELGSELVDGESETLVSRVYITTTRANGDVKRSFLKEVQGTCNALEPDPIIGRDSEEFLCYYAGFGEVFRIKETEVSFVVEKKDIEEVSPEYNPPLQEFSHFFEVTKE